MSSSGGFSIDQLMELGKREEEEKKKKSYIRIWKFIIISIAGLSVAQAVEKAFDSSKHPNVLVCVGPGTFVYLNIMHE